MIKELAFEISRYVFDGVLLLFVWASNHITFLNTDALWSENFGDYADTAKKTFQVIITILIALTAFYRLRREMLKYRKEKKSDKID